MSNEEHIDIVCCGCGNVVGLHSRDEEGGWCRNCGTRNNYLIGNPTNQKGHPMTTNSQPLKKKYLLTDDQTESISRRPLL